MIHGLVRLVAAAAGLFADLWCRARPSRTRVYRWANKPDTLPATPSGFFLTQLPEDRP